MVEENSCVGGVVRLALTPPESIARLRRLSEATRVPQALYLREALDDLLKKYAGTLRKTAK